jgi:hypothetical protein
MIKTCAVAFVALALMFTTAGCGEDTLLNPYVQWEAIDAVDMTPLVDEVATLVAQGVVNTSSGEEEDEEEDEDTGTNSGDIDSSDYSDLLEQYGY